MGSLRIVETHGQGLRHDVLLDPVDERMERGGRLAAGSATIAMSEARDLVVAEEVVDVGVKVLHAVVVVVGRLVRDDIVGLEKKLVGCQE